MSRSYTRAEIRARALDLADMTNSRHPDTDRLNDQIDVANGHFRELLAETGFAYQQGDTTTTLTAGDSEYDLPADFLSLLKVEYRITTTDRWRKLHPVATLEDHRYGIDNAECLGYQVVGDTIKVFPPPSGSHYLRIRYVPRAAKLTGDSDTIDGFNGWEEMIVLECVIYLLSKADRDVTTFRDRYAELEQRVRQAAEQRNATEGNRIVNVYDDEEYADPADLPRRRVW